MATGKWRGHTITCLVGDVWRYDDGIAVQDDPYRACGHCTMASRPDGHDPCLGRLRGGVINACCGHGEVGGAYVQFVGGITIRRRFAKLVARLLRVVFP